MACPGELPKLSRPPSSAFWAGSTDYQVVNGAGPRGGSTGER